MMILFQCWRLLLLLCSCDQPACQQVPAADHGSEANSVGMGSGRTVMTFDITMHQSDTASLGVTVHVSPSNALLL